MADCQAIINSQIFKLIPLGFCACGCGGKTAVPERNHKRYGWVKGQPRKFLRGHNRNFQGIQLCRDSNHNWKGGRFTAKDGYTHVLNPTHVRSCKGYVREHILLAEKALGKSVDLPNVIHHHAPDQLIVCENQAYHLLLHQRTRAYRDCGHAKWRKCKYCQQYDDPGNMYVNSNSGVYHRQCVNNYQRNLYKKLRTLFIVDGAGRWKAPLKEVDPGN